MRDETGAVRFGRNFGIGAAQLNTRADGPGDGLEWEDLMPDLNRASDPSNMIWKLIDRQTGAESGAISRDFRIGDR